MENWIKEHILEIAIVISIPLLLAFAFDSALNLPDVHVSHSTGECVEVINYSDTDYTCDNYPEKYNHVWVK